MDELSEAAKRWMKTAEGEDFLRDMQAAISKATNKCYSEAAGDKLAQTGQITPFSDAELLGIQARIRSEAIQELKRQGWTI